MDHEQYGRFLETIPDVALLVDQHGTIRFANTQVQGFLGYSPCEIVGRSMDVVVSDANSTAYDQHEETQVAAPGVGRGSLGATRQVTHRDGYPMPAELVVRSLRLKDESVTLYIIRDMRRQEAVEARLRRSEEQYRRLVEDASEVFYAVDLRGDQLIGEVTFVSPQIRALTGYSSDCFLRDPQLWMQLVAPEDLRRVEAVTAEMLRTGAPQTRQYRMRDAESGSYRYVEERIVPRYDSDGRISGYQGVGRDVTELAWQHRQFHMVASLATVLRVCPTQDALVAGVLDGLLEPLEVNGAAYATHGDMGDEVVFELGRGHLADWTGRRVQSSASVSAKVIATGTRWVTNGAREAQDLAHVPLPPEVIGYASIPVRANGPTIGALVVTKGSPYADQEIRVLEAVAEMAAVALQRQALHEELVLTAATLEDTCERTIEGWARALDMRDRATEGHTRRVTDMTLQLARRLGLDPDLLPHIRRGAMLHDIGKMAVPDQILRKPGALTEDERAVMRKHVEWGYAMLAPIEFLQPALDIPRFHHERWDGTGYAQGLKGDQIPLAARIFALVDVYDAITSERPYAAAESHEAALAFIRRHSGSHFDPAIAEVFLASEFEPTDGPHPGRLLSATGGPI